MTQARTAESRTNPAIAFGNGKFIIILKRKKVDKLNVMVGLKKYTEEKIQFG